jgi:threonine dehydrogenase-like Zn-dependent dehydrogenase
MPRHVSRLEVAKRFGATTGINGADGNAVARIMKITGGAQRSAVSQD